MCAAREVHGKKKLKQLRQSECEENKAPQD